MRTVSAKKSDAGRVAFLMGGGISAIAVVLFWLFVSFVRWDFALSPTAA